MQFPPASELSGGHLTSSCWLGHSLRIWADGRPTTSPERQTVVVVAVVINLGNDRPVSIADLIRIIEDEVGQNARIQYHDRHEADPLVTWADIGRARTLLGWSPEVSIEEGIRRTVAWYRANREWAKDLA